MTNKTAKQIRQEEFILNMFKAIPATEVTMWNVIHRIMTLKGSTDVDTTGILQALVSLSDSKRIIKELPFSKNGTTKFYWVKGLS